MQVLLLISRTSALTLSVGGVAKDWLLVGLGVAMYSSPVTRLNLEGYSVAFLSVRLPHCCCQLQWDMLSAHITRWRLLAWACGWAALL
jgi:hypothetical protein